MSDYIIKTSKDGKYVLEHLWTDCYSIYKNENNQQIEVTKCPMLNKVRGENLAIKMFDCITKKGEDYLLHESTFKNYFNEPIGIKGAKDLPKDFDKFLKKWAKAAEECEDCMWYVKYAGFKFRYNYQQYTMNPSDIGCCDESFDMISNTIENDLENMGCEEISYSGMID